MIGNVNDLMNIFQQLQSNPMQLLNQRFNIPQNIDISDPNAILQHLMNTGQVNQNQINQVMQLKNNPIMQKLMSR